MRDPNIEVDENGCDILILFSLKEYVINTYSNLK